MERVGDIGDGMMWKVIRYQVIESEHLMLEAALSVPPSEPCLDVGHSFLLSCFEPSPQTWRINSRGVIPGHLERCNSPGLLDCINEGLWLEEKEKA